MVSDDSGCRGNPLDGVAFTAHRPGRRVRRESSADVCAEASTRVNNIGGGEARVRLRRATSSGLVEDVNELEKRVRCQQPDEPIHRHCDSLLSWSAEYSDYSGVVNWAFTLLFLGGARLCLENIRKYGLLVDPPLWFTTLNGGPFSLHDVRCPSLAVVLYLLLHAWIALLIEKALARNLLSFRVGAVLHTINIVIVFLVPHIVFMFIEQIPIVGMTTISFACVILALKLVSYAHVNKWCRDFSTGDKRRHRSISFNSAVLAGDECGAPVLNHDACIDSSAPQTSRVVYPHNLNATDFLYFLAVPTLCYELNFPRSNRIRLWFVARRVFELIVGINVLFALFQQWIIPSVCNSLEPFSKMHLTHTLERLLKLAIPNHLLWIMMFYLMFHSLFNLLAELLRFGDRRFYCDWWNCQDTATFWRTWNVPVHRFAMRHLYLPLIRHKFSRFSAALAVFFLSAFLHEYLVGFPLRLLRVWAFIGMMMQIPLSYVTAWVRHHMSARLSNVIVWLSLIVGQPLAILMYYHDYIIVYRRDLLV